MRAVTAPVTMARQDGAGLALVALGAFALYALTRKPAKAEADPGPGPGPGPGPAPIDPKAHPLEVGGIRIWAHDTSKQQGPLVRRETTV